MKEPSVLNLLHKWILTLGCRVFVTHSRQCSTPSFPFTWQRVFIGVWQHYLICPLTAHAKLSVLSRDEQAGRVGATEVHMFKFKPNPRRMHELLRKTVFQRNILCCHEAFKTESILSVFWTAAHVGSDEDLNSAANSRNVAACVY